MKKKFTKDQKKLFKALHKQLKEVKALYWMKVDELENIAKTNTGLEIEFFHVDGECVGVGTVDREYKLFQWID